MPASRPNIVWLTLDSVRQDHTSMAGYRRDTTPELQRIAETDRGLAGSNCFAHSTSTLPSSASILTGTCPSHHTVGIQGDSVPPELATIPELFSDAGYYTACLSRNGHVSSGSELDRGFQRFEWVASSTLHRTVSPVVLAKYFGNLRRHSAGFTTDTAKHATPYLMNETAKRWLRSFEGEHEPFFLYLHYNEPHRPYYPPLPYLDTYTDEIEASTEEAADISMEIHRTLYERVAKGDLTDQELEALVAMYDAEITYTDERVGELFEFVLSLDLDETVFIVTADHGELFGEYGLLAHKLVLDDALINVPLVVHGADLSVPEDALVQHIDVLETLLSRAGGDTEQFQGVNLDEEVREHAVAQRPPADFEAFLEHNPDFDTSQYHAPLLTALRTREFKYQRSDEGAELFALPDETTDVAADQPEVAEQFDNTLTEFLETEGQPVGGGAEGAFTDAMRRQLRDLGYVD